VIFSRAARFCLPACLAALCIPRAFPQDERSVASPDGSLVFRLLIAQPSEPRLFRIAYQILRKGKPMLGTSFLGINIHDQEPVLGENAGLTASRILHPDARHNVLIAEYMQNGSIGRRINVEAGVWNDGAAFRYVIPRTTPLEDLLIEDEETEFSFAHELADPPRAAVPLPFLSHQPEGWIGIYETGSPAYPRASLLLSTPDTLITRLIARPAFPQIAYEGTTPISCPWRIVILAPNVAALAQTAIARDMLPARQRE
jgi:hypothetical protein